MAAPGEVPASGEAGEGVGFLTALSRFWGSVGVHLTALVRLWKLELSEASAVYAKVVLLSFLGAGLAFIGYIFLLLFLAFALERMGGVSWVWISLGFAVLHFVGLALCYWKVRELLRTPTFPNSAAEFEKTFRAFTQGVPSAVSPSSVGVPGVDSLPLDRS